MDPEEGELFLASPAVKKYHINRNLFFLKDHKVLWKNSGEEGEKRLLVVPRELRQEVLRLCHNIPAAGHQGPVFQNGVRPGVSLNLTKSATKPKIAFFKTA